MKKFRGKMKIAGIDLTICPKGITIFDKEQRVEKEDSWKICEYLINEGYFESKDFIKIDIIRPISK